MGNVPAIIGAFRSDEERLADCERRIEAGFVEAGKAFREIRDGRLYPREYGEGGFDTYCQDRWGVNRGRVDQLIKSAEVHANLHTNGMEVLPTSERQVRVIAGEPPEQQVAIWGRAVEKAGDRRVTTRHVEEAKAEIIPPKPRQARAEIIDAVFEDAAADAEDEAETEAEPEDPADPEPEGDAEERFELRAPGTEVPDEWKLFLDATNRFFVSLPRRGGVAKLMARWNSVQREGFIEYLSDLRELIDQCLREYQEQPK